MKRSYEQALDARPILLYTGAVLLILMLTITLTWMGWIQTQSTTHESGKIAKHQSSEDSEDFVDESSSSDDRSESC